MKNNVMYEEDDNSYQANFTPDENKKEIGHLHRSKKGETQFDTTYDG